MDIWTKIPWNKEACDLAPDPKSGAPITRLTGSMIPTNNNYYAASCSADGKRCIGIRFMDPLLSPVKALLVLDIERKWTGLLDATLVGWHALPVPFAGVFYYVNSQEELCRVSLDTFDKEVVLSMRGLPPVEECFRAVTPDGRYLFYLTKVVIPGGQSLAIVRLDLGSREAELVYENAGLHNFDCLPVAPSVAPGGIALYVGRRTLPDGSTPPLGAWKNSPGLKMACHLADINGKMIRTLGNAPGYMFYDRATGRNACNCAWDNARLDHLRERPQGNMVVYGSLDWQDGRVIEAPEHLFQHIAGSRCGRYVVAEAFKPGLGWYGPMSLVIVNIATGKHRTLVEDCGAIGGGGGGSWRQPVPYITSDNRHVIYSSDLGGLLNVYAAQVPAGFLESLG